MRQGLRSEEGSSRSGSVLREIKSNLSKDRLPLGGCWNRAGKRKRVSLQKEEEEGEVESGGGRVEGWNEYEYYYYYYYYYSSW